MAIYKSTKILQEAEAVIEAYAKKKLLVKPIKNGKFKKNHLKYAMFFACIIFILLIIKTF